MNVHLRLASLDIGNMLSHVHALPECSGKQRIIMLADYIEEELCQLECDELEETPEFQAQIEAALKGEKEPTP